VPRIGNLRGRGGVGELVVGFGDDGATHDDFTDFATWQLAGLSASVAMGASETAMILIRSREPLGPTQAPSPLAEAISSADTLASGSASVAP